MFLLPTYQHKGWPRRAGGILYTRTAPCNKKSMYNNQRLYKSWIFMWRPRKTCTWPKLFITLLHVLKPVKSMCIPNTEHYIVQPIIIISIILKWTLFWGVVYWSTPHSPYKIWAPAPIRYRKSPAVPLQAQLVLRSVPRISTMASLQAV